MPTRINLDLDTLRTFAVAHDLGGLGQAAEQLGRTPSAISLQMRRLQDDLGVVLLRKSGRKLALTEAGVAVLDYARRILALHDELIETMQGANVAGQIRIGCPQDFASMLPAVLSHFSSLYPKMQIELRIEGNAALADAVESSQLDLAIVIGHESRAAARALGEIEVMWIASPVFAPPRNQPLPLAVLGPQCAFRKRAIEFLDARQIPYRIAVNSPSLDGMWAALLGGVGMTARTAFNLPEGLVCANSLQGLPDLGKVSITLHRGAHTSGPAVDCIAGLLTESLNVATTSTVKARRISREGVIDISTPLSVKRKSRSTIG